MTNDPANIAASLRALIVYAVCALLAIIIGVMLANPLTYTSLGFAGLVLSFLSLPLLFRWHHPLLLFCWNTPVMVFFLKGDPNLFLVMIAISLTISVVQRAINQQQRFIHVPSITAPLICLIAVILVTAKLTGGFGLRAFGSDVYGGKKYIFLIVAILGYFAITARPVSPEKARLYMTLYFLGGMLGFVQDFYAITPGALRWIYWLLPPTIYNDPNGLEVGVTRLAGVATAAICFVNILIARYGLRGIFLSGKLWRPAAFFISIVLMFFGGFRSSIIVLIMTLTLQFFLEGLHRTKLMPLCVLAMPACAAAMICLGPHLPFTFQRALAFLPREVVRLSPDARINAQASIDWRLDMWKSLLPQVPKHLLLGKGYAITMEDFQMMGVGVDFEAIDPSQQSLALSGDYHNGPLSVILPFGIWGAIAFVWFIIAGLKVTYYNYRYGDPSLSVINTFLFTTFVITCIQFYGGTLATNMNTFTGVLGLSVCINNGMCRKPARQTSTIAHEVPFARARLDSPSGFQPGAARPA